VRLRGGQQAAARAGTRFIDQRGDAWLNRISFGHDEADRVEDVGLDERDRPQFVS
jgi:hypothetical protein